MSDKPLDLEGLLDSKPLKDKDGEVEAVLDPDFVDDSDAEFLPQEELDGIAEEEK